MPSSCFTEILGDTLLTNSTGDSLGTEKALQGKTAVGLYFSAHWCGPCRGFTPKLAEVYKAMAASGKSFEIVFVSSDRDEAAFKEYYHEQPWLALPYSDRKLKAALSKKYKVQGIPTLVILDGETGELITKDGRSNIMEDPKGESFPWRPPTLWEALGEEFLNGEGDSVELSELRGEGKVLGLYFSAHWCPPCKTFTPQLIETYQKLRARDAPIEVIFVSSDRDMSSFQDYFKTMPWLSIPPGDKRKAALSSLFEVQGIPSFVLIDAQTGKTITSDGRAAVGGDPEGLEFPWHPKPVLDLEVSPDGLNEETCLCLMVEGCSEEEQAATLGTLTEIAEQAKASADERLFFCAKAKGPIAEQVRKITKLGDAAQSPQLLILDIPDQGGYYTSDAKADRGGIEAFLAAHKAGTLTRQQLE